MDGKYRRKTDMSVSSEADILVGQGCSLPDWCVVSPCLHGGSCKQRYGGAYCKCEGTGYVGAVCGASLHYRSCIQALQAGQDEETVLIDLDGSGPLPPAPLLCQVSPQGEYVTSIQHSNMEDTKVDGFQARGSFHQVIHYDSQEEVIKHLLLISSKCWQSLTYNCKQSRLFNTPVTDGVFAPYGWWVSWANISMSYWPGSVPGSRQCGCGVVGECFHPAKECHCDSGHDGWLQDGGDITTKDHLPVRALHFGDTGTPLDSKEGRFSLGALQCSGDLNLKKEESGY